MPTRLRLASTLSVGALLLSPGVSWGASVFTSADSFAPSRFGESSADVTNRYLPMAVGRQYVYEGTVVEGGESTRHRVVFTVTGLTKVVDGVRNRVILDQDYDDDELGEQEIALFAQDSSGVVWNLGEYPEEYDAGKFSGAPSVWLAGAAGARAGISMQAHPATGTPEYSQGYAPAIDFDDRGRVSKTGARVEDGLGSYRDGVVVDEYSASEPGDGHQRKFHAPGQGVVAVEAVGGKKRETLQRVSARTLGAADLAGIEAKARAMDARAYRTAPKAWRGSAPIPGGHGAPVAPARPRECVVLPARLPLRPGC